MIPVFRRNLPTCQVDLLSSLLEIESTFLVMMIPEKNESIPVGPMNIKHCTRSSIIGVILYNLTSETLLTREI